MKKAHSLLLLLSFLLPYSLFADHNGGATLTYKCLGGLTYEIKLEFYRDCRSPVNGTGGCNFNGFSSNCSGTGTNYNCFGTPTAPVYFQYFSPSCGFCTQAVFPNSSLVKTDVAPICPGQNTSCNGGSLSGYQKWTYTATVVLPQQCRDWTFVYGNYARSTSLTTVNNAINTQMAVIARLNNSDAPCNSSPNFSSSNISYLCAGKSFCFNQSTIEPDGDSLVYSIVRPYAGPSLANFVTYTAGYSYTDPFGAASPVTFDSKTGSICVTPASPLVTLMDVEISEYRNGVRIGSVMRDMQFVVTACNNEPPSVTGINGAPYLSNNISNVCSGQSLCFTINGLDPDAANNLTLSWNNAIPGATFTATNNGTSTPSAQFCWTPTLADERSAPYVFTVTIEDDNCPFKSVQSFPFSVYVRNCTSVNVVASGGQVCPGACQNVSATPVGGTPPYSYAWTPNIGNGPGPFNVCPASTTVYTVVVTDAANNTASATATVSFHPAPAVNAGPDKNICPGSPAATLSGSGGVSYSWSPATGLSSATIANPTANPAATTTYTLNVTDANGCTGKDSVTVTVAPLNINAGPDAGICAGGSATLNVSGPSGTAYTWSPAAGLSNSTVSNPVASPTVTTTYTVQGTGTGSNCTATDTITVTVSSPPVVDAGISDTISIGGNTVLKGNSNPVSSYSWSPATGLNNPNIANPVASPTVTTTYTLTANNNGCTSIDSVTVVVINEEKLFIPNILTPTPPDGKNDKFNIIAIGFKNYLVKIYNRWGQKVFESSDANTLWDGTILSSGKEAASGVYYYILNLTSFTGDKKPYTGFVTLVRDNE